MEKIKEFKGTQDKGIQSYPEAFEHMQKHMKHWPFRCDVLVPKQYGDGADGFIHCFGRTQEEARANADLAAAGLDLLESLKWAQNEIKILQKQIPLHYNLAKEQGKTAWERHSAGMIKIENAINKAVETPKPVTS